MYISSGAIHGEAFHLECFQIELQFRNVDFFFPPLEGGKQENPKGNPRGRGLGLSRLCSKMLESCPVEGQKVVEKLPKILTFKSCHQNLLTIFIKNINLKLYISFLTIIATIGQKNGLRFD